MSVKDLISILTPSIKGREWFLERNQTSIAWQTYPHVEHVLVTEEGIGPMPAFQLCLDRARGEFVMPVSDDDWLAPHALETLRPYLDDYDLVFGRTLIVSPGNDRLVSGHAAIWRKSLTEERGYNLRFKHAGDTELYGRLIQQGVSFGYCPEPLYVFTEHSTHNSHIYRDQLAIELKEIKVRYADAHKKLAEVVPA